MKIRFRLTWRDAEGKAFPGPVMEAPPDAVELAGTAEFWIDRDDEEFILPPWEES